MLPTSANNQPKVLAEVGKVEWIRAHVSVFAVGAVLLVCLNLVIGGDNVWALTAIGIWALLLLVHAIVLVIARLSGHLLEEDDEEVVLLPIQEATFTPGPKTSTATPTSSTSVWPDPPVETPDSSPPPTDGEEVVSWQVATDKAHLNKPDAEGETTSDN